jgi:hypothetical protein
MWTDFLIFGSVAFWLFAIIAVFCIGIALETTHEDSDDTGGGLTSTIILIVFVAVYYLLGSSEHIHQLFKYIGANILEFISIIIAYFAIGVVWSFFKWFFFLRTRLAYLESRYYAQKSESDIPLAKNNKNRIASWITYWMISMAGTLLNDAVRKGVSFIIDSLSGWYDKMSRSAFEGYIKPNQEN